jgi:ubiquinone/menaquinone biosynthesis C-methylase UbiE
VVQPPAPSDPVTPDRILQMTWGFTVTRTICTALELDLFTRVAEGQTTTKALLAATKASARGLPMIVDALVGLGLLTRTGTEEPATLGLSPDAAAFLSRRGPAYLGDLVLFHGGPIDGSWRGLTDSVRTGRPAMAVDAPAEGVPFWHGLVDSLFALGHLAATQVGKELARLHPKGPIRLLDVAAGSGVWAIGAAEVEPRVRPTIQDLPETMEHARRFVARAKLGDRVAWLPGDLRKIDFGTSAFEAAVLGHIVHSEGEAHSRALFRKVAKALVPGGTIVVVDFVPEADRSSPPLPLLFALNMLVLTTEGSTYTLPQYRAWLEEAGFRDVRTIQAAAPSPPILATR